VIRKLQEIIPFEISDNELISFSLDISRSSDKRITEIINDFKIRNNLKISSRQKNLIRDFIIGKSNWPIPYIPQINKENIFNNDDIERSLQLLLHGIERNPEKVFGTLKSRLNKARNGLEGNIKRYEEIFFKIEKNKNQLLILRVRPEENLLDKLKTAIMNEYDNLSNYHYFAVIFEDSHDKKMKWSTISKFATFCEFMRVEKNFRVFNRQKDNKIEELIGFVKDNENINYNAELESFIRQFYNGVSYGFQFNDLFISKKGHKKILVLQKIELDEKPYPCPDCMETIVRSNSYPKLLQRSFECQNPNCPSRSKIGRGKRYDLLSVKRNLMIELNSINDQIPFDLSKKYRRDIIDDNGDIIEMLVKFYSWDKNKVLIIENSKDEGQIDTWGRVMFYKRLGEYKELQFEDNVLDKLISSVIKNIDIKKEKPKDKKIEKDFSIYCGDSSKILFDISEKITGAITSPPYYNAREYSQWPTFICYLIDMAISAKAVFDKLEKGSYYFYNIGDIVGQDNVFISSHMSKRRLMLGFYTANIFEKIGFNFIEDIIWDKQEVESKRNSTENLFPGYIKPINCYEHILIFGKECDSIKLKSNFLTLNSVKKINSKGVNILGHTAPYPEELVATIFAHFDQRGYLLDPFLGSGTTIIASKKNHIKSVGIELDERYYYLALERIFSSTKTLLDLIDEK